MHGMAWFAGLLGLIALAFGKRAASAVAKLICISALALVAFVIIDKMTAGQLFH